MKNIEVFGSPFLFEMSFLFAIVYAQPKPLVIKKCIDKQIEYTPPVGIDRILSLQVPTPLILDNIFLWAVKK